ncbi:MAG: FAD-dependent oxidoreductase [Candidatus Pacearchaeota archaeon]
MEIYDVIILGAGPAGMTAALYCARYQLKTLVLGKEIGGQANYIYVLENYPGIEKTSGIELVKKLKSQLEKLKVEIKQEEAIDIKKEKMCIVKTHTRVYFSKTMILALGTESKKLGLKNENKLIGKGISYCATCDAPLFKNKVVAVVGSGNSAVMTALLLAEYAKKVYLITKYEEEKMKAENVKLEEAKKNTKIEILRGNVKEVTGKNFVEAIILENGRNLECQGIFVEIGKVPRTDLVKQLEVKLDDKGYILVDKEMKTNVEGIFAAGDCIAKSLRQIITAASDGAIAAHSAYKFLKK